MSNAFDKLKQMKPHSNASVASGADRAIEEAAHRLGFVKDAEELIKKRRRGSKSEPTESVTMRVHVGSWNMFVELCDRERLSYKEAFDLVLRKAGVK